MSGADYSLLVMGTWAKRRAQIDQVAAAVHRINNEPGMAENPVWIELVAHFDRATNGQSYWEAPF